MKLPRLTAALAALLLLLVTTSSVFAAGEIISAWTQNFDSNTTGWIDSSTTPGYGTISQVPSGTGGITSATGAGHAEVSAIDGQSGPFSRFDGYRSVWPGTWTAEIDIYLDPAAWPTASGFDYSVAANGSDGAHQRDFIFHVAKYDNAPGDRIVIAADNNSNNDSPRTDLETAFTNFKVVTTPGWYTFQHIFYEQSGVLKVKLNLLNASGTVLFSETRTDPSDTIPAQVGGNRYAWFTFIDGGPFAIDNHAMTIEPPTVELVTPNDLETSTNLVVAGANDNWLFYNDETDVIDNSLGTFVVGPAVAPQDQGSVQISVTGTQRRNLATYQFRNTPLADISTLAFSTYNPSAGNGGSTDRSGYLNFNVSFNGLDTWQSRLVYVPSVNGTVVQNTWQEWDAINGGNALWSWSGYAANGNQWPDGNTTVNRTWTDILTAFPASKIRATDSWLGIRVGEPYNDGYTENIDGFKFGVNGSLTIFDFEPNTVVVTPNDLETSTFIPTAATQDNWLFYNDETDVIDNSLGTFVVGPDTAPKDQGSVQISVSGTQRRNLATYQFRNTPLADISTLAFSTYNPSAGNGGSPNTTAFLNFNVSFNGADTWQSRLVYVPSANGTVVQNTWQRWDAIDGGNALWSWSGYAKGPDGQSGNPAADADNNQWPDGNTTVNRTWTDILTAFPASKIRATDSWLGIRVGNPDPAGYTENIDAFIFGTTSGLTIFDFEPRTLHIENAAVNMHGNNTFDVPVLLNSGTDALSSAGFTVAWNQSCLVFDSITDSDNNGVPNSVSIVPSSVDFDASVIRNGSDQEVTILITPKLASLPLPVLGNGTLATLTFNIGSCDATPGSTPPLPVVFSFPASLTPAVVPSFGNNAGQSVDGVVGGGTVILSFNAFPNDILLDDSSVDENLPAATAVGNLCTTDDTPDGTDCAGGPADFTYSLETTCAAPADSAGNFAFQIADNVLQTAGSLNKEAQALYNVCIQSTDAYGLSRVETFAITVNNVNEAPTDIQLSDSHVNENEAAAPVGNLSTVDEDLPGDSHTYIECPSSPSAEFDIVGNVLQTVSALNAEAQSSYNVCIRSTDAGTLFVERTFTISVDDVNDTPVANNDFTLAAPLVVIGNGVAVQIDVLANDTDQDGDTLTINPPIGAAAHGTTAIVGSPNKASYTAAANYTGPDSFTYSAKDPDNAVSNAATVSLAVVANNDRADCNADGQIDAADFPATVLEIFDTDSGIGWWLTYTGAFPGSPLGCDSNNSKNGLTGTEQSVDAADIICTVLIFFGNTACTASVSVAAAAEPGALIVPDEVSGAEGETVTIPVTLETGGNRVAAATFALSLNGASFDPTDSDEDGVPDAITLNVPAGTAKTVIFDAQANRIQVAVYGTSVPMPLLSDGALATIDVQLSGGASALTLTQASLGGDDGQSIPVDGSTTPTQGNDAIFLPLLGQE